jgi:hypothetical protein
MLLVPDTLDADSALPVAAMPVSAMPVSARNG